MNNLVKLITNEDGDEQKPYWHLAIIAGGGSMLVCSGEFYGFGEGCATFEVKKKERGGITCPKCLSLIAFYKSVKL